MTDKIKVQISMSADEANWLSELLLIEENFPWTPFFSRIRGTILRAIKKHDMSDEELWEDKFKRIEWDENKFNDYAYRGAKGKLRKKEEIEWINICYKYNKVKSFSNICEQQRQRAVKELNPLA